MNTSLFRRETLPFSTQFRSGHQHTYTSHQKNIAAFILVFIAVVGLTLLPRVSNAGLSGGSDWASNKYYKWCKGKGAGEDFCTGMAIVIDPIGDSISDLSITMQYDPSKWTLNTGLSGFMCAFSKDGTCFDADAAYGTQLIGSIYEPTFGLPASGIPNLTFPTADKVSLQIAFDTPVPALEETNMYAFVFEPTENNTIDLNNDLYATYYDSVVQDASFVQDAWACSNNLGAACGSTTPILSGVISVAEPTLLFMLIPGALSCLLGIRSWKFKRRMKSYAMAC